MRMVDIEGLLLTPSETEMMRKVRRKRGQRLVRLRCRLWLERKVKW